MARASSPPEIGLVLYPGVQRASVDGLTARSFIIDPPGRDQRAYSVFLPRLRHGDAAILKVQHWLQRIDLPDVTVAAMAEHARLEPRTFQRRFQRATGFAPLAYCQNLRIGRARVMLESTTLPVDQIAWQCGYKDPKSFRKVFAKIAGLSPGQYRQRFSAARQEPAPRQRNAPAHAG
ncbi:GlxA family transcriptional regulator [Rhodopseudomonas palustris]|uniref:GlxA family transcriptional regulator n=1 Tax=Rhodopseudomonas palustris TaxID=1076 RepID=UPI000D205280|nr:helix-turn-helix domain-containing protein [Rhodopseudomonas palustris]AVT81302.1 transcriptional regulator, AraC family [Rhodopseudomonas palustris]